MPTVEAQIDTERPSRYLVQFCKHAAAMGGRGHGHGPRVHLGGPLARGEVQVQAEWSDTRGTVTFTPWGQCTLQADANTLTVRIEASNKEELGRIKDIITRDFARFSQRDPLTVTWHHPDTTDEEAGVLTPTHTGSNPTRRGPRNPRTILLAAVAVLAIAVHLGLGGTVLANSKWTTGAVVIVLAIIAVKIALIIFGRRGIRHHTAAKAHHKTIADHDVETER
jgi:hypothetical protein